MPIQDEHASDLSQSYTKTFINGFVSNKYEKTKLDVRVTFYALGNVVIELICDDPSTKQQCYRDFHDKIRQRINRLKRDLHNPTPLVLDKVTEIKNKKVINCLELQLHDDLGKPIDDLETKLIEAIAEILIAPVGIKSSLSHQAMKEGFQHYLDRVKILSGIIPHQHITVNVQQTLPLNSIAVDNDFSNKKLPEIQDFESTFHPTGMITLKIISDNVDKYSKKKWYNKIRKRLVRMKEDGFSLLEDIKNQKGENELILLPNKKLGTLLPIVDKDKYIELTKKIINPNDWPESTHKKIVEESDAYLNLVRGFLPDSNENGTEEEVSHQQNSPTAQQSPLPHSVTPAVEMQDTLLDWPSGCDEELSKVGDDLFLAFPDLNGDEVNQQLINSEYNEVSEYTNLNLLDGQSANEETLPTMENTSDILKWLGNFPDVSGNDCQDEVFGSTASLLYEMENTPKDTNKSNAGKRKREEEEEENNLGTNNSPQFFLTSFFSTDANGNQPADSNEPTSSMWNNIN